MDSLIFPPFPHYSIHASCYRGLTASNVSQSARRIAYKRRIFVPVLRISVHFFGVDVYKVSGNYACVHKS